MRKELWNGDVTFLIWNLPLVSLMPGVRPVTKGTVITVANIISECHACTCSTTNRQLLLQHCLPCVITLSDS